MRSGEPLRAILSWGDSSPSIFMLVARFIRTGTPLYEAIGRRMVALDIFFLMRPTWLFPVWIMVVAGISAANSIQTRELYWVKQINWSVFTLLSGVTLISGGLFARHVLRHELGDDRGQEAGVPVSGRFTAQSLIKIMTGVAMAGMVVVFVLSVYEALLSGRWHPLQIVFWSFLAFLILGSRFGHIILGRHEKPLLSTIANGLSGLLLFLTGWSFASSDLIHGVAFSLPYSLAFAAVSLLTTIPQKKKRGRRADLPESPTGIQPRIAFATALVAISAMAGYSLDDPVISTAAIVSLPFFLVALVFNKLEHVIRAVRYPVLILALLLCVRYPWFFVALFITFYLAKWYYYFRLNIDYPTFHVDRG